MRDYATCGSCHLAHAVRFALAPHWLQRYARRVSRNELGWFASLLHSGAAYSLSSRRTNFKRVLDNTNNGVAIVTRLGTFSNPFFLTSVDS